LYAFTIRIQGYQLSHYEAVPASGQFPAGHLTGSWPVAESTAGKRALLVLDVEIRGPGEPLGSRISSKSLPGKHLSGRQRRRSLLNNQYGGLTLN
jgi:hypothetical protein